MPNAQLNTDETRGLPREEQAAKASAATTVAAMAEIARDEAIHADDPKAFFVYLYRDDENNPVYVGQAKRIDRARAHIAHATNKKFADWLKARGGAARIEVIGPLGSKRAADVVETAIISVCHSAKALKNKFLNSSLGVSAHRFAPLGVPAGLALRTIQPLSREEIVWVIGRRGKVIFVHITDRDVADDTLGEFPGYNVVRPPTDEQIRARMRHAWKLQRFLPAWCEAEGANSPALLVGLYGKPKNRFVIGCAAINQAAWQRTKPEPAKKKKDGLLVTVPLYEPKQGAFSHTPIDASESEAAQVSGASEQDALLAPVEPPADPWGIDEEGWRGRPLPQDLVKFAKGKTFIFQVWDQNGKMTPPEGDPAHLPKRAGKPNTA